MPGDTSTWLPLSLWDYLGFGRNIKMGFEQVKLSPEMVAIAGGWGTVLAVTLGLFGLTWNIGQDINNVRVELKGDIAVLRTDMSDLRTELKGDIATLRTEVFDEISGLKGRVARVEGLLEGYIERSRAEEDIATVQ